MNPGLDVKKSPFNPRYLDQKSDSSEHCYFAVLLIIFIIAAILLTYITNRVFLYVSVCMKMLKAPLRNTRFYFFLTCFVLISQTDYFYYLYCHHLIKKNWTVCKRYFAIKVIASGPQGTCLGTALWTLNFYDFHIILVLYLIVLWKAIVQTLNHTLAPFWCCG